MPDASDGEASGDRSPGHTPDRPEAGDRTVTEAVAEPGPDDADEIRPARLRDGTGPARVAVARVGAFLDGVLDVAVASFAVWTLLHAAMLVGLPMAASVLLWLVASCVLVILRVNGLFGLNTPLPERGVLGAVLIAVTSAGLASVISRPDADDAWYMASAVWAADRGQPATRDVIFSGGEWPATVGAVPNLSSIETWFGAVARWTGIEVGDVAYRYFTPLAAFGAAWALWVVLRAWGARRPTASLALAMLVVVLGGYAHTTFGNMHLARIWQGKALLLAVLVPYLYATLAAVVRPRRAQHRRRGHDTGLAAVVGVSCVGASSTAVFLVPLIVVASALPVLWRREWGRAAPLAAAAVGPVLAGLVTALSAVGSRNVFGSTYGAPLWVALADWRVAVAAGVAAAVVLLGVLRPGSWGTVDRRMQGPLLAIVVCGVLFTVEPLYSVFTALTGGEAIAHRFAWVLPLPALIGLVASLPLGRLAAPVLPVTAVVAILVMAAGTPLWATSNGAHLARPGSWKVRAPEDVVVARWVVEQRPTGGYLAANWVTFLVGTMTSELRPVGSRLDYVTGLDGLPGAQAEQRALLQRVADGADARTPENREAAVAALDDLSVSLACVAWNDDFTDDIFSVSGFRTSLATGPWTCWQR